MKFIKHIFEMKLSQKEMVRAKRVLALFMIPIFVLQMCSINLFLTQVARAEDEPDRVENHDDGTRHFIKQIPENE